MSVTANGPLLDGTAAAATAEFCDTAAHELAEKGRELVQDGTSIFRHPTGTYRAAMVTEDRGDGVAITDGGLVYGPWLAGTTRRNRSTGFHGYHHWDDAARELDSDMIRLVTPQLRNYRRKLGGRR